MPTEAQKAEFHIKKLEEARLTNNWNDIQEITRKIDKHAPDRKCLTITARAEGLIAKKGRPKSVSKEPDLNLTQLVPVLEDAARADQKYPEEAFQGQACVAWIFWSIQDPGRVLSHLPKEIPLYITEIKEAGHSPQPWTKMYALRSACIEASIREAAKQTQQAVAIYKAFLPTVDKISQSYAASVGAEYRDWLEQLIINYCLACCSLISENFNEKVLGDALIAFRTWMKFWDGRPAGGSSPKNPFLPKGKLLRRIIWRRYHEVLARVIQYGDVAFADSMGPKSEAFRMTKLQQWIELRQVQNVYEGLIMNEISFPKAEDHDVEVEEWVQEVMGVWYILQSDEWRDEDLGKGGKEGMTREVLEILYRSVRKTFHSVLIIRHQFTLYYTLAEFEMALNTFNTYFDLVHRAKKRIAKSGKKEDALDDDGIILLTISEAIQMLSAYGALAEAQKAADYANTLEGWLPEWQPASKKAITQSPSNDSTNPRSAPVPPVTLDVTGPYASVAYCAMGIAKATLARLTFDAAERNTLQDSAVLLLKRSLSAELGDNDRPDALYALALLLAEQRDLNGSTAAAKLCLQITSSGKYQSFGPLIPQQVRRPIEEVKAPLMAWHLLSLQLSARSHLDMSLDTTEAAISQETPDDAFETPERSLSRNGSSSLDRSSALDSHPLRLKPNTKLHHLHQTEVDALLQLKMTQIMLVEICDGSDAAVNMSGELLNLHSRCYEIVDKKPSHLKPEVQQPIKPLPKSTSLRSIRGSIFGRNKSQRKGIPTESFAAAEKQKKASLPPVSEDGASIAEGKRPRIHVTQPSFGSIDYTGESNGLSTTFRKLGHHKHPSASAPSTQQSERSTPQPAANRPITPSAIGLATSRPPSPSPPPSSTAVDAAASLSSPPPLPPSARLPRYYTRPTPSLPLAAAQRRSREHLFDIWLCISGLYRRASLYSDADDALRQAGNLVAEIEGAVAADEVGKGYKAYYEQGWGRHRPVEELRADLLVERGVLAMSRAGWDVDPSTSSTSKLQGAADAQAPDPRTKHTALLEAYNLYETALTHTPNHPGAIKHLANILMDFSTSAIFTLYPADWDANPAPPHLSPQTGTDSAGRPTGAPQNLSIPPSATPTAMSGLRTPLLTPPLASSLPPTDHAYNPSNSHAGDTINVDLLDPSSRATQNPQTHPEPLDRIAALDRAFGLLSTLTKLGSGWNDPEAWIALARAYELSGQPVKAREALWWVVELEEGGVPVAARGWSGRGGYVLS